jgi:hypothetical protein
MHAMLSFLHEVIVLVNSIRDLIDSETMEGFCMQTNNLFRDWVLGPARVLAVKIDLDVSQYLNICTLRVGSVRVGPPSLA